MIKGAQMLNKTTNLSKNDFEQIKFNELLENLKRETCWEINKKINKELINTDDKAKKEIYLLLGAITSLKLDKDIDGDIFIRDVMLTSARKVKFKEINDSYSRFLEEIIDMINLYELKARIADFLWIKDNNYEMSKKAIGYYLKSAEQLEDAQNWSDYFRRVNRAISIAASIRNGNEETFEGTTNFIMAVIKKYEDHPPNYLSLKLMKLLQHYKIRDFSYYAKLSNKYYEKLINDKNYHMARKYSDLEAGFYKLLDGEKNNKEASVNSAETYVLEAKKLIEEENYLVSASLLKSAIEKYRRLEDYEDRINEIHKLLLVYEKKSVDQMMKIEESYDISSQVKKVKNLIKGLEIKEALFKLAIIIKPPKINNLKQIIEELKNETPLTFLLSSVAVNEEGKTIARKPSIITDDQERADAAVKAEMFMQAKREQHNRVVSFIIPATQQIRIENNISLTTFIDLVKDNPFVPRGHEMIFAKGLMSGLKGDYLNSLSLLIPQLENSLRYVLIHANKVTSNLNNGIQEEFNLNKLLNNYEEELNIIFGEDLIFDLKGVFIERFGSNLRNKFAHGLMNNDSFYTAPSIYAWWLILRLCCIPNITLNQNKLND